ncbi:MAG: methyl-accepting chemotaxis protein [Actinomycetota bacterium]
MLNAVHRVPLRAKLSVVVAIGLVGVLAVGVLVARDRQRAVGEAENVQALVELSVRTGALVHELQKERGGSALFLASGGDEFGTELRSQHSLTDEALGELRTYFLATRGRLDPTAVATTAEALAELDGLASTRRNVLSLDLDVPVVVGWYTAINSDLIDSASAGGRATPLADFRSDAVAYVALMEAKERAGIERAQLSTVFARDEFQPGQVATIASLIAAQSAFTDTFLAQADDEVLAAYEERQADPVVAQVADLEALALGGTTSGFGVDATEWFALMTERINLYKEVEDFQAERLYRLAEDESGAATNALWLALVVSSVTVLVASAFGIVLVLAITRQLRGLDAATAAVAAGELDLEPLPVLNNDEIARVSRSFNTMTASLRELLGTLEQRRRTLAERAEVTRSQNDELNSEVGSVSTSLSAINAAIADMAGSATSAAEVSRTAVAAAGQSTANVADLEARAREMQEDLAAIDSIAKQTTLLALNATIEAARAGAMGRGFAVVAGEVGELARQASTATDAINTRMGEIRSCTASVATANEEIAETIDQMDEISASIAAALHEQSVTTEEIADRLDRVAVGSDVITEAIEQLADAASDDDLAAV